MVVLYLIQLAFSLCMFAGIALLVVAQLAADGEKEFFDRHLFSISGALLVVGAVLCMMMGLIPVSFAIVALIVTAVVYGSLFLFDRSYRAKMISIQKQLCTLSGLSAQVPPRKDSIND